MESFMDVLTLSFPTTTDTLRVLSSIRRAAESVVNKELRIERDVSTAISIRQLIWKAKDEDRETEAKIIQRTKRINKQKKKKQKKKEKQRQKQRQKQQQKQQQKQHHAEQIKLEKDSNDEQDTDDEEEEIKVADDIDERLTKEDQRKWSVKLPRHLDPEPMLTVVRMYDPNDSSGTFIGLRVLVLTKSRFFLCHENLNT
jgi:DNA polymerase III alpha subunit (gram-positive type)